jgi:hypothetical protein
VGLKESGLVGVDDTQAFDEKNSPHFKTRRLPLEVEHVEGAMTRL